MDKLYHEPTEDCQPTANAGMVLPCVKTRTLRTPISPKPPKKKLLNRSAICLLTLALGISTTTTAVAFIDDRSLGQQIQDLLGGTTGSQSAETVNQVTGSITDYLRQAEEFYRNISNKNISGILGQLESILGQMGILSPSDYPEEIGEVIQEPGAATPGSVPGGDPTTPARIYEKQQIVTDTANSDQLWIYTDSVLGKGEREGQTRLQQMNQINAASSQAATNSYEISASRSQQAAQNGELAQVAAGSIDQLSEQAQSRTASQDVLKDLAAQNSGLGKSNAAISSQLATLSEQQAIAANQVSALSTQSRVANEHLTELRVGQAIGNVQLHDIFNAQRHDNHMQVIERQKTAQLAVGSTDGIYIPGFLAQPSP